MNYISLFFDYFLLFFIYSVLGWVMESIYVSSYSNKFVNRGFLIGPYCPIYGCGALIMIFYLTQYQNNILTVFILGVVICAILEYFTSYIMELIFKTRWWDYSDRKFNLNGRVCGRNAFMFGICGVFVIYILQPILTFCMTVFSDKLLFIISIIIFIIFAIDCILSFNIINRFKKTVSNIEIKKDSTQEISKMVQDTLKNGHLVFQNRLVGAFPNINLKMLVSIKDGIKEEILEFKDDIKQEIKERLKKY